MPNMNKYNMRHVYIYILIVCEPAKYINQIGNPGTIIPCSQVVWQSWLP